MVIITIISINFARTRRREEPPRSSLRRTVGNFNLMRLPILQTAPSYWSADEDGSKDIDTEDIDSDKTEGDELKQ